MSDEVTDDMILAKAQELRAERPSLGLTSAMLEAEAILRPSKRREMQTRFEVTVELKPRHARWVHQTLGGHPQFSVEERLGAFLSIQLGRIAVEKRALLEEAAQVVKGEAVTVPAHLWDEG
jgi:hypothetical protein